MKKWGLYVELGHYLNSNEYVQWWKLHKIGTKKELLKLKQKAEANHWRVEVAKL